MASMTALGGAAPPVATSIVRAKLRFTSAGAWTSMLSTIGAPHRWVTPASLDQREDHRRVDLAQADMGAADGGDRPGVGPAVAVEHRQRPQIDRTGGSART